MCHTDIHAANGDWPVTPTVPFIPGHEGVGIVTGIGNGVTSPQVGQRVAVPWLGYACGTCKYCLTGWETLCLAQQNTGYSIDGCYAEYFLAEAAFATPVPDGLDPREAAPLSCAGRGSSSSPSQPGDHDLWQSVLWCIGILVVFLAVSLSLYRKANA